MKKRKCLHSAAWSAVLCSTITVSGSSSFKVTTPELDCTVSVNRVVTGEQITKRSVSSRDPGMASAPKDRIGDSAPSVPSSSDSQVCSVAVGVALTEAKIVSPSAAPGTAVRAKTCRSVRSFTTVLHWKQVLALTSAAKGMECATSGPPFGGVAMMENAPFPTTRIQIGIPPETLGVPSKSCSVSWSESGPTNDEFFRTVPSHFSPPNTIKSASPEIGVRYT
mmetsp:Transcript_31888/g.71486  ORF Transcript_31888/g.71486 Transcript_31888/m.71486 type:complete len:222 (+) Transcript_31888:1415-2080(+)